MDMTVSIDTAVVVLEVLQGTAVSMAVSSSDFLIDINEQVKRAREHPMRRCDLRLRVTWAMSHLRTLARERREYERIMLLRCNSI